jgi:hypothetical protein
VSAGRRAGGGACSKGGAHLAVVRLVELPRALDALLAAAAAEEDREQDEGRQSDRGQTGHHALAALVADRAADYTHDAVTPCRVRALPHARSLAVGALGICQHLLDELAARGPVGMLDRIAQQVGALAAEPAGAVALATASPKVAVAALAQAKERGLLLRIEGQLDGFGRAPPL